MGEMQKGKETPLSGRQGTRERSKAEGGARTLKKKIRTHTKVRGKI